MEKEEEKNKGKNKGKNKTTKVIQRNTLEIVNDNTGEITHKVKTTTYGIEREPPYIKMYIDDIARLNHIPPGMNRILLELIRTMGYNNIIMAYRPVKIMLCQRLQISEAYLKKALDLFYQSGLLIRIARGVYMADPDLFARGSWEDIKNLRLVIDYNEDGTKSLTSNLPEEIQLRLEL